MNLDERRWVQRYLGGDASGFDAIYDANCDRIYRLCYRLSGSKADAEDLTQDVFIAASRGLQNFQHRASLSTWLYRIALDCWRAQMRKKRVEQVFSPEDRLFAEAVQGELNILDRIVLER